jgi:hypothetical protein
MVSLRVFGHPTYGQQSTIHVNLSNINAHQFFNQLDCRSITKRTIICTKIWTGVLHDWKRALYHQSYQPLTLCCCRVFSSLSNAKVIIWNCIKINIFSKQHSLIHFSIEDATNHLNPKFLSHWTIWSISINSRHFFKDSFE